MLASHKCRKRYSDLGLARPRSGRTSERAHHLGQRRLERLWLSVRLELH